MSRYALEKKCRVSREMIACIECGDSIPTFYLGARLILRDEALAQMLRED